MSNPSPEDREKLGSALPLGDLNLESLGEVGTSLLLLRNLATEIFGAVEHVRSAATSIWKVLDYLRYPDGTGRGSAESSGPLGSVTGLLGDNVVRSGSVDDLLNPLDVVGRAADATDIRRLLKFPGDTTSGSTGPSTESKSEPGLWNPFATVTDAVNDVLGGTRGQSAAEEKPQSGSDPSKSDTTTANGGPSSGANGSATDIQASDKSDKSRSGFGLSNNPVTDILGGNPVSDLVGKTIGSATKPVVDQVGEGLRQVATPLGLGGIVDAIDDVVGTVMGTAPRDSTESLRKRGNALIKISYKPECQRRDVHPSFSRIIDELLPDEARILRFLGVAGTQPMIDVRTKTLFQLGSELLLSGVSMIAQMAGCHWCDRDQHYLANLGRLGLIELSREPVADYRRYALLEVQPAPLHVIESVPKSITIYRSVKLTAFGQQFVDTCIDTEGYDAGGWNIDGRRDKLRGKDLPSTHPLWGLPAEK